MNVPCIDMRAEQEPAHRKTRVRNGKTVQRDPIAITGICLHQTAVRYGVSEQQLRLAGGNKQKALARRSLNVACHAIAFRDGFFAVPHQLTSYVLHANGLNAYTLGLEIDGRYPGLVDNPDTVPRREDLETVWGGDPDTVTDTIVQTACAALHWLVTEGRAMGMPITSIYAHRQSSATRRSDPGQALWSRVAESFAIPVLGLKAHYALALPHSGRKKGMGRPIPRDWARDGVGKY